MYHERRKRLPPDSVSLSDALNQVKKLNITLSNSEQLFVFVNESTQIIIVTCKTNLQFFFQDSLITSSYFCLSAYFKLCRFTGITIFFFFFAFSCTSYLRYPGETVNKIGRYNIILL